MNDEELKALRALAVEWDESGNDWKDGIGSNAQTLARGVLALLDELDEYRTVNRRLNDALKAKQCAHPPAEDLAKAIDAIKAHRCPQPSARLMEAIQTWKDCACETDVCWHEGVMLDAFGANAADYAKEQAEREALMALYREVENWGPAYDYDPVEEAIENARRALEG